MNDGHTNVAHTGAHFGGQQEDGGAAYKVDDQLKAKKHIRYRSVDTGGINALDQYAFLFFFFSRGGGGLAICLQECHVI